MLSNTLPSHMLGRTGDFSDTPKLLTLIVNICSQAHTFICSGLKVLIYMEREVGRERDFENNVEAYCKGNIGFT